MVPDRSELPPHWSVSAAEAFEDCARRWHGKYVEELPDPPGDAADIGSMVHAVMEQVCWLDPWDRTIDAAARIAGLLWVAAPRPLKRTAWEHVTRALADLEIQHGEVVATEQRVLVELGGVMFKGFVDRLDRTDGGVSVIDYKTGFHPPPWFLAPKLRQVTLYAAAIEALGQGPVTDAALFWTRDGQFDRITIDQGTVEEAVWWLRGTWDDLRRAVESQQFPPTPSALCSWCPQVSDCPEGLAAVRKRAKDGDASLGEWGVAAIRGRRAALREARAAKRAASGPRPFSPS